MKILWKNENKQNQKRHTFYVATVYFATEDENKLFIELVSGIVSDFSLDFLIFLDVIIMLDLYKK